MKRSTTTLLYGSFLKPCVKPGDRLHEARLLSIRLLWNRHVWSHCETMRCLRVQVCLKSDVIRIEDALGLGFRRSVEARVECCYRQHSRVRVSIARTATYCLQRYSMGQQWPESPSREDLKGVQRSLRPNRCCHPSAIFQHTCRQSSIPHHLAFQYQVRSAHIVLCC